MSEMAMLRQSSGFLRLMVSNVRMVRRQSHQPPVWFLVLFAIFTYPAFCGIRPSFGLDYSAWHATHIVVVTTTTDGSTFEVLETLKGDLKAGERIVIPQLRPTPKAIPISLYPKSWEEAVGGGVNEVIPKQLPGSRMILFLQSGEEMPTKNKTEKTGQRSWKPADILGEMKASVLWIDGSQVYCFIQLMNPGPSVFFESHISEQKVRDRVIEVANAQRELVSSVAESDGALRAERLKPFVQSDIFLARSFALDELGKAGSAAVPTIRGMLDDPAFRNEASGLAKALALAGGEGVGEELNKRLQQNLAFWKSAGPTLGQGWWNQDLYSGTPLRGRYSVTYELVIALEHTHYSPARRTAIELRNFWRSLPQLNDPSDQMANECDKLIDQLQPENPGDPEN